MASCAQGVCSGFPSLLDKLFQGQGPQCQLPWGHSASLLDTEPGSTVPMAAGSASTGLAATPQSPALLARPPTLLDPAPTKSLTGPLSGTCCDPQTPTQPKSLTVPLSERHQAQIQCHVDKWKKFSVTLTNGSVTEEKVDICDYGRKIDLMQAHENPVNWWRQQVLLETLDALKTSSLRAQKLAQALKNVQGWKKSATPPTNSSAEILVEEGDWGEVTLSLTKKYGATFAVLNMAHAECPGGGGGYVNGTVAQEENMFRRTDCHFSLKKSMMKITPEKFINVVSGDYLYTQEETGLINARGGLVYLDTTCPRVCFRGKEEDCKKEQGYKILSESEWFPFYELRAAAMDLRLDAAGKKRSVEEMHAAFQESELKQRVVAQFETLKNSDIRHVVLSAFGCGAFGNPATSVARVYAEVIPKYASDFDVIAFGIFYAGYGPRDNYEAFKSAM